MSTNLVAEKLCKYAESSRLSMNQIAQKWGVSAAILSQIKNQKKAPGLDLGLKILRESQATLKERQDWLSLYGERGEVGLVIEDEKKDRVEYKLQNSFSELLENNPLLLDLFLDISFMKEKGLSYNGVLKNYGEYGISLLRHLQESGVVLKKNDRFYISKEDLPHVINLESSFGVMKSTFETLKLYAREERFKGEFHFDFTDISPEGYEKLKKLNLEYTKKAVAIVKENEMPRVKGGLRVMAQNLIAVLKCFVIVSILHHLVPQVQAQGTGLTGGGSGNSIQGINTNILNLNRSTKVERNGERLPYTKRVRSSKGTIDVDFKHGALKTDFFNSESATVESIVEINKAIGSGNLDDNELRSLIRNLPLAHCKITMKRYEENALKRIFTEGYAKALGFKVEKSYFPNGKPRFQGIIQYALPCIDD